MSSRDSLVRKGFTLIELSLSLVFIGILSVLVVLIINNTIESYRRGITLNKVNTTGMDLVDDMRSAVQNSSIGSITGECAKFYPNNDSSSIAAREQCVKDGGRSFVSMTKYGTVILYEGNKDYRTTLTDVPLFGAFCTGSYTYIWNSGYFDSDDAVVTDAEPVSLKYNNGENDVTIAVGDNGKAFRLLKVRDDRRAICVSKEREIAAELAGREGGTTRYIEGGELELENKEVFDISDYQTYHQVTEEPIDLILTDSDNDLAIYDLHVADPAESGTQENIFYSISFILGTMRGGVNITAKGKSCMAPSDYEVANFDYCAINNFNFAVQANGGM